MGRIRTVKPEAFTHEGLFELEQQIGLPVRVGFFGLWTQADREGRFVWAPRTLKLGCLPHDQLDFSRVLDALWTRGHIEKYASEGREYGFIPSWSKHQVINNRETPSVLPEPTPESIVARVPTGEARVDDALSTRLEGKGKEGKGKEEGKEGKGKENTDVEPTALDHAKTIFEFWQKCMNSPKSVFDAKRKSIILKALKSYSPADICKAIRGCSKTPHNMGQNANGTKYNGLDLILRDADHIDRFIASDSAPRVGPENEQQRMSRLQAEFLGHPAQGQIIEMGA